MYVCVCCTVRTWWIDNLKMDGILVEMGDFGWSRKGCQVHCIALISDESIRIRIRNHCHILPAKTSHMKAAGGLYSGIYTWDYTEFMPPMSILGQTRSLQALMGRFLRCRLARICLRSYREMSSWELQRAWHSESAQGLQVFAKSGALEHWKTGPVLTSIMAISHPFKHPWSSISSTDLDCTVKALLKVWHFQWRCLQTPFCQVRPTPFWKE